MFTRYISSLWFQLILIEVARKVGGAIIKGAKGKMGWCTADTLLPVIKNI